MTHRSLLPRRSTSVRPSRIVRFVALVTGVLVTLAILQTAPANAVTLTTTKQAMNGDQRLAPGTFLAVGYTLTVPGAHPSTTVSLSDAVVRFDALCPGSASITPLTVAFPDSQYVVAANDNGWIPSDNQLDPQTYQATVRVPDLCLGNAVSLRKGGALSAGVSSDSALAKIALRWHYRAMSKGGNWSSTFGIGPATTTSESDPAAPGQIVVKIDRSAGYDIEAVTTSFPVAVVDGGIASRGVYLLHSTDPRIQSPDKIRALAQHIDDSTGVVYAEPNLGVQLADTQLHAWPFGTPTYGDPAAWSDQPARTWLDLPNAHAITRGGGITVAVLDTGIDSSQPVFENTGILTGWNYVDDNADVSDPGNDLDHLAGGHGTFVAGLVRLVAPDVEILPEKVLDGQGHGTIYSVAQAIDDAVAQGANVVNLSLGVQTALKSKLISDAIHDARQAGVVVVAAAGNDADNRPHFPASCPDSLSVAASSSTALSLTSFSDWGGWIDVAAPGDSIVGPVPGGFATWSGTSMAAPLVAGQAALLFAAVPGATQPKVVNAIESTARGIPNNRVRFGAINLVGSITSLQTQ